MHPSTHNWNLEFLISLKHTFFSHHWHRPHQRPFLRQPPPQLAAPPHSDNPYPTPATQPIISPSPTALSLMASPSLELSPPWKLFSNLSLHHQKGSSASINNPAIEALWSWRRARQIWIEDVVAATTNRGGVMASGLAVVTVENVGELVGSGLRTLLQQWQLKVVWASWRGRCQRRWSHGTRALSKVGGCCRRGSRIRWQRQSRYGLGLRRVGGARGWVLDGRWLSGREGRRNGRRKRREKILSMHKSIIIS